MTPLQIGVLGCGLLCVVLLTSMPVAFAMAVVGFVGFALVVSPEAALHLIAVDLYDTFANHSLTVIPLFVLMGQVAFHAGLSRSLFSSAYAWLGPLPGGLAMATVGACTAFGAICGSGPATAATMAAVALPEMRRYRYHDELSCGTIAAGGTLAMLIPPSIVLIVYGILTEQSIGRLFVSGIVPGLLIALLFCGIIYLQCRRRPDLGPAAPAGPFGEKLRSLGGVWSTLVLFALVMGGMFQGFFTPTEAAAVGAAGSLGIAAAKRQLSWKMLRQALLETVRTSCMVLVVVAGAMIFGHFLAVTQVPSELASWMGSLPLPAWGILSAIILFYLVAGCFVDALALVFLTVPIFYPVVLKLGCDPIWFGVMIVVVTQMGVITPPVGVCVYVVSGIARDVPMQGIFRSALPFLGALLVAAVLLVAFPTLVTFLPSLLR